MYVVTNRIDVKKGFAEKMAPKFTQGGKIQELEGFQKVEVWLIDDEADYDQMYINTWWDSEDDFKGWLKSDAFKEAHEGKSKTKSDDSPILGNKVVKANVISELS
ncbi:heme-degrading monooxygenase IsdG [Staphylococcus saprophyticus]|jgi:heme oxygenase (staphylobilin-producing)|uniref:Heme oxygenase (staphylobilin-producing) n=1 Tax=Staphylococcus saprophyticus subsp. saprophyticus (strain ATCC 15305 / DSM 20229 / NCIMB 8711 / NCTC 7292 / S-41) TaxID=342451 RepID=HDOX_STAS1|nr:MULTISPECIES: heme oxygenase [Staphylococcus]Q49ZB8.1 RecName: Full=Heme oxygenase (staphylobilin-producing); AltName: Full=Heme-degrading monooxygenase; AltName: Full=Iron-regulated surface determinant; AltName: Full=Iron-responsive surface determinant [Staphylococcus saprophyticus subsp. saprophyticus ATCC 15305 = NCTC 7292]CRV28718.1 Heme-degrading monooxygenase isdI [Streptococcus equi subsp. equi]SIN59111.1 Heme-degrading monooxygenase isdI [Mycobacteroides abscessus subsp. abscessus]AM